MTRIESDGKDIFVVYNGKRIAKRSRETLLTEAWVSLEPGYSVLANDLTDIIVTRDGKIVR
jgi:hypothetical protein